MGCDDLHCVEMIRQLSFDGCFRINSVMLGSALVCARLEEWSVDKGARLDGFTRVYPSNHEVQFLRDGERPHHSETSSVIVLK